MRHKIFYLWNPYFFVPFLLWVVLGGGALLIADRDQLFFAFNGRATAWLDPLVPYVDWIGEGYLAAGILLGLLAFSRFRRWDYFLAAGLSQGITSLVIQGMKSAIQAPRPMRVYEGMNLLYVHESWPELFSRSFPSGHTGAAFCLLCFLSLVLTPPYRAWGIVFFLLALMAGLSRIYLAAHFFADVYWASILAVAVTSLTVFLVKTIRRNRSQESEQPK